MPATQAQTISTHPPERVRRASARGPLAWHEARWGLFFISPWIVGFLIFQLGPMLASLYFSFTEYNVLRPPKWIGLENYRYMFDGDPRFWQSVRVTFYYVVLRVPPTVIGALICAIMLNQAIRARVVYRTIFFIPSITPAVAAILVWTWVLDAHYGLLNYLLSLIGITGPSWLGDPRWAVPSLVLLGVWGSIGGTSAVIFLSALQEIPVSYYEAAKVDGANWFQLQRFITVPLLTPAIFFVLVLTIIGTFQTFTAAYVGTNGGPAYATYFYVLHLYQQAFRSLQMGYSSALAWVLVVILLIFTWIQFKGSEKWVHYGS
jgi:multiple sugar transport system permease protein